jgi:hypothetical protein
MKKVILASLFSLFCAQNFAQRVNQTNIESVVSYLSSDELQGRATGTLEERKAAKFIAEKFKMMALQPFGNDWYYYDFTKRYNVDVHDTNANHGQPRTGRDVIAFLDNKAEYTVVIGAHYDHLGLGFDHNSLDANPADKIHNGADDNASGVAGMIELANFLTSNGITERYNFLFMAFSGEELGLFGSKSWCEKPTLPLKQINYMINLDMIGRLNEDTRKLLVYGIGTSPNFETTLDRINTQFSLKKDSSGVGPSDHTSFYLKDIPVLFFFTGQHSDYHKPTDDADKINYAGIASVLEYLIDVIYDLDKQPKQPFLKTAYDAGTQVSFKVTMGLMPDYAFDGKGMRIDDVSRGKPAEKGGLQKGDIILNISGMEVNNVMDYMKVLGEHKKGDTVEVLIRRGDDIVKKEVTF